ncbi:MAG: hypothetical protein H0T48_07595 [Gemmatimonadaceae bacterium]|nr:hypothetical protein [Gemmatimonadaceae bacterium]
MRRRLIAVLLAAGGISLVISQPPALGAQAWNDARTRALVERATERRARQIADTALADYKAAAHGYLTFLAQVGEGFTEPPKIVRADELALEVYWRAPNLSKQLIAGRRDTLLLPTDINYHRDHLGIVQNNFPNIIRLGDGDEVRDVPHPLSADGLEQYDFAIRDSLQIRLGPRTLDVYEVRVRPKNEREARAVGAVYVDRESGEVVRMAFSFTRQALKDKDLEDVSVVLENGLIEGRFWLPRRQEIEIRRTGTWLDYPARGIIRGRWEICCYEVNKSLPAGLFAGPEIALAPRGTRSPLPFTGQILDSLPPDVRAVSDEDVAKVQEEARALVRAQSLARSRALSLSARNPADIIRINRVEGLALGAGLTRRLGDGFSMTGRVRYGFSDDRAKGRGELAFARARGAGFTLAGYDDHREAGDEMETSITRNSIAAQEFGSDYTDPFGVRGFSVGAQTASLRGWTVAAEAAFEKQRPLSVNARPSSGRYEPAIAAWSNRERRLTLTLDRPTRLTVLGLEAQLRAEARLIGYRDESASDFESISRLMLRANFEKPVGRQRFVARSLIGTALGNDSVPVQHLVFLGGPTTGPGYEFHQFAARAGASQRIELRTPAPFPSFPLGRYGRTPASITLAPYFNAIWINHVQSARPATGAVSSVVRSARNGWYPSVGIGALSLFDLVRFDVARGLQDGRWMFSVDAAREFWGFL